ncbi:hypothetical protein G6M26_21050 [Agrobacterium tumefaciens]|nr:hypothetical protein [Agrobacterium tumefaciens]NTE21027.1 hypothetical protein [Agrobacterium tumefaciens]
MNSYNENLNAVVVTSLQSQSLNEKAIYSKLNAAMFTLYYAEGATISAEEKLEASQAELATKAKIKAQAVNNTNLSNNLLASATQTNAYFKQSINNTAVCAANVQVAANAIVRLAGDIGSIFSIVNAADRNSDIFRDTESVRTLIDHTAYTAEVASKLAMETSAYTSEVSAPTVLDKAKSANLAINNLLSITSGDYDHVSKTVTLDNATLSALSAKEKLSEGILEDISVDYHATQKAYDSTNEELNLNLGITHIQESLYHVSFNRLENPFFAEEIVQDYHIVFVKETKKATFSMANAEGIRVNAKPQQYIKVYHSDKSPLSKTLDLLNFVSISEIADPEPNPIIDSDGEPLVLGKNYVVFLLAVFSDQYKREINNFDDFLSAPSKEFLITNALTPVDGDTIEITEIKQDNKAEADIKLEDDFKLAQQKVLKTADQFLDVSVYTHKLMFSTAPEQPYNPVHRCIFLPANPNLNQRLLTTQSLKKLLKSSGRHLTDKEKAADAFKMEIDKYEADLKEIDAKEREVKKTITSLNAQLKVENEDKDTKKLTSLQSQATLQLANLEKEKAYFSNLLKKAQTDEKKMRAILSGEANEANLHFFFNLALAEQVSASNYTTAMPLLKGAVEGAAAPKVGDAGKSTNLDSGQNWIAFIGPETTDNFGDFLIDGHPYYAIVLTLSGDEVDNPYQYTNALSSIYHNCQFTFKANLTKK